MLSKIYLISNWTNGVIMIGVFGLVCLALVGFLVKSMSSSDRKNDKPEDN